MLARDVDSFLEMMAAERGAARNTLESYRRDLEDFAEFLSGDEVAAATQEDVRAYLSALVRARRAPRTQARRLSCLRQFFRFLYAEGLRRDDPTLSLDSPRLGRPLPKYLNEDEVSRLLEAARALPGIDGIKAVAFLELLYATGLRVSEICSLPLAAVSRGAGRSGSGRLSGSRVLEDKTGDGMRAVVTVRGKGGKERMVPLHATAREALAAWRATRDGPVIDGRKTGSGKDLKGKSSKGPVRDRYLFPGPGVAGHFSRSGAFRLLHRIAVAAGVPPSRVSPHVLRHSFASHLIAHDADLRSVQQLLGHADIATTEIYTHIQDDRLRKLVNDHHPLAGLTLTPRKKPLAR